MLTRTSRGLRITRTGLLRAVRTEGSGQLAPGRALLHVRCTRTSLGRAVRTAHRGTTGCGAASVWITHNQEQAERVGGCRVSFVPEAAA